jgi:hypothetical protein
MGVHKRKFSGTRVCRVTFKHLPQPLQSHIRSFGTIGQLFKIPPFSAQKSHSKGGRGGPQNFVLVGIIIFLLLKAHAKFQNPTTIPSGRISNEPGERERKREKMPFIVATYIYASSQGQRTHSARTN